MVNSAFGKTCEGKRYRIKVKLARSEEETEMDERSTDVVFHYDTMKKDFNCKLLYSDTNSFVYEIFSNDFFADLKWKTAVKELFYFSNFPTNHDMYDQSNARVT